MSSLDRNTLRDQVREELIETGTTQGQWSDTEIIQYLQDANEAVQFQAQQEADPVAAVTVANQEYVNYPASIKLVKAIYLRKTAGQGWIRLKAFQPPTADWTPFDTTNVGQPNSYIIWADKIYLLPIPDAVYDVKITGHKAASDMVAANVAPNFDNRFHWLCKLYAVARCKQKVDDPGYANYDGQYAAGIVGMKSILAAERNGEGQRHVEMTVPVWE